MTSQRPDTVTNKYPMPTVCFDFDGTLNEDSHLDTPGAPRPEMWKLVRKLRAQGFGIVVFSARPPTHFPIVKDWLYHHHLLADVDHIALGTKPSCDVFVDDKGLLPPPDALYEHILIRCFESPIDRWSDGLGGKLSNFDRQLGLCRENPNLPWEQPDVTTLANYQVLVPCSGGLDSATALAMCATAGLTPVAVYVDTGAPYAKAEIDVVRRLCENRVLCDFRVEKVAVDYTRYGYVDRGRNAIIIWTLAHQMRDYQAWGEIAFGNIADVEETPIVGGDKTLRFFATMQHLLTISGFDVRLTNPVGHMRKSDLVRWWQGRGHLDVAINDTRSCYDTVEHGCGQCRSCFRRYMAFAIVLGAEEAEAELRHTFPTGWSAAACAAPHAKELRANYETPRYTTGPELHAGRVNPWVDVLEALEVW